MDLSGLLHFLSGSLISDLLLSFIEDFLLLISLLFIKIELIKLVIFGLILIEFFILFIQVNLDLLNLSILGNTEGSIEKPEEVSSILSWVFQRVTRVQQSGFVQQRRHLLRILVIWVVLHSLEELLDDWMVGIDLEGLLLSVLRSVLLLGVGLGSSDLLHLSGVTSSGGEHHNWVGNKLLTHNNRVTLFLELILKKVGQGLVHLLKLLELSLLNIVLGELEVGLGDIN